MITKSELPPNIEAVNEDIMNAAQHPQESDILNADCSNVKNVICQTIALEYFGRNKTTQTRKSMLSTTETKGTQTLLTVNSLSKLLAFPKMNSTGSQTELSDNVIEVDSLKTPQSHKTDANIEISEEPKRCESDCSESCSES